MNKVSTDRQTSQDLQQRRGSGHDGHQDHVQQEEHCEDVGGGGGGTVKKKLDRTTRGIVPDRLVQVQISNFLTAFPNLGRGPSMWEENANQGNM
jgi:hypothetical protein